MVKVVSPTIYDAQSTAGINKTIASQKEVSAGQGDVFSALVKNPLTEVRETSSKADQAIIDYSAGKISEIEYAQNLTEASLALEKLKVMASASLEGIRRVIDMPV